MIGAGDLRLSVDRRIDQRSARVDALVPADDGEAHAGFDDGGPHDREREPRIRDDLLADALRVRVGVGPAPELRALRAHLREAGFDVLATDLLDLDLERLARARLVASLEVRLGGIE